MKININLYVFDNGKFYSHIKKPTIFIMIGQFIIKIRKKEIRELWNDWLCTVCDNCKKYDKIELYYICQLWRPTNDKIMKGKNEMKNEMKDEKELLEELEIDILELDDVEGVPATAASSGSGGHSTCGSTSCSSCSSSCA